MAILESLNPMQQEAARTAEGALLIVAGAGSGKTKTIAHRIAHIIAKGGRPGEILAVTFTNKAANEMKTRIESLLARERIPMRGEFPFVGTFHALGVSILRAHGRALGVPKHFTILDEEDSRKVIKELIQEFELDPDTYSPPRVRNAISQFKNELTEPDENPESPYEKNIRNLYLAYEATLARMKALDFDDLLAKTVRLFEIDPVSRAFYEKRWRYIHIDEYQDTNRAQYTLSRILAGGFGNIAVVGDIDQAIYSWRGADWRNIVQFEKDWPDARIITLEENYRSTKLILEAANAVIVRNKERKEKNLFTNNEAGEPIGLVALEDERQEAAFVVAYIEALGERGIPKGEIAVLFRTNAQSRALEEAFLKKNIPYRLVTGVKFYERKEIKDVLAYLKYALNEADLLSKKRILNTPPRGIGKILALKYFGGQNLSPSEQKKVSSFEKLIHEIRKAISTQKASDALKYVFKKAGFDTFYRGNKLEADRLENIKELLSVTKKFDERNPPEGIEELLTEASLATSDTEIIEKDSMVTLLTAHAAKGLEFRVIIIAGMEEGLFPHALSQDAAELEEERRLFYVAITRAKEKVMITLARKRLLFGEIFYNDPSRFLGEIPSTLVAGTDLADDFSNRIAKDEEEDEINASE